MDLHGVFCEGGLLRGAISHFARFADDVMFGTSLAPKESVVRGVEYSHGTVMRYCLPFIQ